MTFAPFTGIAPAISPSGTLPSWAAKYVSMNDERESAVYLREEAAATAELARPIANAAAMPAAAVAADEPKPLTHSEKRLIVMSMMLPVFLGSIDQSILATALPTIGRVFGDVTELPWVITSYLIAATALTPLYGKFADIHGRRASLLIALTIYMSGALISATASSMLMLICGRVVQGMGGGGMISSAQMVLGDMAPPKERAKYYTYFSIAFTTAGGCGPALGGWICDHLSWWMIFIWKIPFCLLTIALAQTMLRRLPRYGRPHRLDFAGAVLVMASSACFMLALNFGGMHYPWLSVPVLSLLGCALVLGAGFVVRLLTAVEPLIPISILADAAARLTMVAHSFGWGSIVCLNIFLPMYLQSALGWSATSSGLSLVILMMTLNISAGLSSQLIGRVRHYKLLPLCFLVVGLGAVVALAWSAEAMSSLRFEIILFLIGVGFGPTAPLTQVALQNTVSIHDLGAAIGTMNFTRTLMGTMLIAIFGAVVLANAPVDAAPGSLGHAFLGAASVATFQAVFLAIAGTLTISFLAVILLEEKPLGETLPAERR
ncbi:MAG TPA: MFS transporter [Xanthobacteraceae bacterium]|nr:MFS transporter [Xanthobacteraceae bacterium]